MEQLLLSETICGAEVRIVQELTEHEFHDGSTILAPGLKRIYVNDESWGRDRLFRFLEAAGRQDLIPTIEAL